MCLSQRPCPGAQFLRTPGGDMARFRRTHCAVAAVLVVGCLQWGESPAAATTPAPYLPVINIGPSGTSNDEPDAFSRLQLTAPNAEQIAFETRSALAGD